MIRKQFYLPEPLVKRLQAMAKRRGISEAEVVLSILDIALLNPDNCIVGGDEATVYTGRLSQDED